MAQQPLILGSASPRRAELLSQLGLQFRVCPADIDESIKAQESPEHYVQRMAREKGLALADRSDSEGAFVLTADTTVVLDGCCLGKPDNREHARSMLRSLSGVTHEVLTALHLFNGGHNSALLVVSRVEFTTLSGPMIEAYLDVEESWDKAGAYAIQGLGGSLVRRLEGSVSSVIGLPQVETRELLVAAGLAVTVGTGK